MSNTFLCVLAVIFCVACTAASFYHYYTNRDACGKRFPIHFGLSGEPDNWSENRHALKLYPGMTFFFSILTVALAATLPFWPAVGVSLCMGSTLLTLCIIQYYAVLIANGTITRVPPLQYYSCLILILISTLLCVVLSVIPAANQKSTPAPHA